MGSGRSDSISTRSMYASYSDVSSTKSMRDVFQARQMHETLSPHNVSCRESCDSEDNPSSTPIILGLDVTGSMGKYAHEIASGGLTKLIEYIYDKAPVNDPHVMFMAVGDVLYDRCPFQASQFEADERIIQQLSNIYLEGGGGANDHESYHFPWYFAAHHTKIDSMLKRSEKGYLFTMGDERCPSKLNNDSISKVMGDTAILSQSGGYSSAELLKSARESYYVFHILITQGNGCRRDPTGTLAHWQGVMDNCVLYLTDTTYLAELIITTICINHGMDADEAIDSWQDPQARQVIRTAFNPQV